MWHPSQGRSGFEIIFFAQTNRKTPAMRQHGGCFINSLELKNLYLKTTLYLKILKIRCKTRKKCKASFRMVRIFDAVLRYIF